MPPPAAGERRRWPRECDEVSAASASVRALDHGAELAPTVDQRVADVRVRVGADGSEFEPSVKAAQEITSLSPGSRRRRDEEDNRLGRGAEPSCRRCPTKPAPAATDRMGLLVRLIGPSIGVCSIWPSIRIRPSRPLAGEAIDLLFAHYGAIRRLYPTPGGNGLRGLRSRRYPRAGGISFLGIPASIRASWRVRHVRVEGNVQEAGGALVNLVERLGMITGSPPSSTPSPPLRCTTPGCAATAGRCVPASPVTWTTT